MNDQKFLAVFNFQSDMLENVVTMFSSKQHYEQQFFRS